MTWWTIIWTMYQVTCSYCSCTTVGCIIRIRCRWRPPLRLSDEREFELSRTMLPGLTWIIIIRWAEQRCGADFSPTGPPLITSKIKNAIDMKWFTFVNFILYSKFTSREVENKEKAIFTRKGESKFTHSTRTSTRMEPTDCNWCSGPF